MSELAAERIAEAVGPIVVKEVRQGLRARVFAICFGSLLAIFGQQLLAVCGMYLGVSLADSPNRGVAALASFCSSLMLVFIGAFAISERDGFSQVERSGRNWLTSGALRGSRLVIGLLLLDTAAWVGLHQAWNHLNPMLGMINFMVRNDSDDARSGITVLSVAFVPAALVAWVVLKLKDHERTA